MDKYEIVIGLEVHIQLQTKSKAYAADSAAFGGLPNTHISAITLGLPGTLPKANKKVIEYAVRLGLACKSSIREYNEYARKNYFYADLPKGYQITQDKTPVCTGGYITIKNDDGSDKQISLTRIHMEEDAGKSIHDQDPFDTLVDLNRAGVPLLEMVTDPVIKSSDDAYKFLGEVRKLVRYLDICDGNMEEGSMRCDANVSIMLKGSTVFGNRVEVKNMNSIRNVQRAIDYEVKRQEELVEAGKIIDQDTRSFDAVTGTTFSLRSKEMANDYRYFPEPDLQPVVIKQAYIDEIRQTLPPLPNELVKKYTAQLGLSAYDASVLTENKAYAIYFEKLIASTPNFKAAANWMMGAVKSYLNENALTIEQFTVPADKLALIIALVDEGKISNSVAAQSIFPELIKNPAKTPLELAQEKNLIQESDVDSLKAFAKEAISRYPDKVKEYKAGKVGLIGLFMGEVMKLSKGKADPKIANQLVKEILDNTII